MKKIRLHPLFILLCVVFAVFSQFVMLLFALFSVLIHEYSHQIVARKLGYTLNQLTLMPYGAVLSGEGVRDEDMFSVAVTGPAVNFFISLLVVAFWWIFPASYSYTLQLFRANMSIGLFNLLPLYPLDGGRIALSFCKNKLKGLKALKASNIIFSILFMALFVLSAFWEINYTLGIASIMLFSGGMADVEKEKYNAICYSLRCLTDFSKPIKRTIYCTHIAAKIGAVTKSLRNKGYFILEILDNSYNHYYTLKDIELDNLFALPKVWRKQTIANYLATLNKPV